MASTKLMETKDGRKFWQISVSRGYGVAPYKTRFYWPMKADGKPVSKKYAESELEKAVAEFARACAAGEVQNRAEAKEKAAQEAAEAARIAAEAAAEALKLKTFKQYADGVFMPAKELELAENTRAQYRLFLDRYIFPAVGDVPIAEVTPAMISKLMLDFQKSGKSHSSALTLYCVLNGVFQMAFMDDTVTVSPMLKVKRPARRKDDVSADKSDKAFTENEVVSIFECAAKEPLKWQTYIRLAYETAARRGEICGLLWSDIDWKSGSITIKRNLQYSPGKGVYVTTPKNGKSRTVYVGDECLDLLRQLREKQAAECVSRWIFTQDALADPMFPQSPTKYFREFGKRYHIDGFHPHKLRHTFASIAITNGGDVLSVSEALGHSDTAVTLRMYGHANEESIRRAGQKARDAVKAKRSKEA